MIRKLLNVICVSSILTTGLIQPTFATIIRSIDAEGSDAYIDENKNLHDDGFGYPVDIKGMPQCPWISPSEAYRGSGAIGFRYPANSSNVNNMQKVGLQITQPGGTGGVSMGQDQYTGFALKLGSGNTGEDFNFPSDSIVLAQYHQGSPHSPPLSLRIIPNSGNGNTVKYAVYIMNDNTAYKNTANGALWGGSRLEYTIKIFEGTLNRGQYYRFIFKTNFQPVDSAQKGSVELFIDGTPVNVVDQTTTRYIGYIGYSPTNQPKGIVLPTSTLGFWIDLYRRVQPSLSQTIYFDNLRIGTSYNEVDPAKSKSLSAKARLTVRDKLQYRNKRGPTRPAIRRHAASCSP